MIEKLQKLYDEVYPIARKIVELGQVHQHMVLTYRPTKDGYEKHGVVMLAVDDKDRLAQVLTKLVRAAPEMFVVLHVCEAWCAYVPQGVEVDLITPAGEQPGAYEAVQFVFHVEGRVYTAECRIERTPSTRLVKGELIDSTGNVVGRFIPQHH